MLNGIYLRTFLFYEFIYCCIIYIKPLPQFTKRIANFAFVGLNTTTCRVSEQF